MTGTTTISNHKNKLYVVVARHGERWDYIQRDKGINWIPTAERPWDPPLSPQGLQQATRLGHHLSQRLQEMNLPPITACYASPLLRCRQTACQAVEAINNKNQAKTPNDNNNGNNNDIKVRVEMGLSESLNESWYRSWALPGADATWGFVPPQDKLPGNKRRTLHDFSAHELHPASHRPARELLQEWPTVTHNQSPNLATLQDFDYESTSKITKPFSLVPKVLMETKKEQQERMFQVMLQQAQPGQTILLVSHGGPVTHLYEKLTGNNWTVHGECTYCCYSIYEYQIDDDSAVSSTTLTAESKWNPLVVNESKYLQDLWSDATSNI